MILQPLIETLCTVESRAVQCTASSTMDLTLQLQNLLSVYKPLIAG